MRDGHGYIDQAGASDVAPVDPAQFADADADEVDVPASGSSVEEESSGEPFDPPSDVESDGQHDDVADEMDDLEIGDEDWDVDDEDWELANGDFTKQYNRVRQQHAAASGSGPLPARNQATQARPGVAVNIVTNTKHVTQEKDKSDRATQDQVLDSRTRLVLAGLVNRNVIGKIERCVSTGKEANVYYSEPGLAVKIYRTSILNFRSRANYIVGEQRFRGEYTSSKNPRKMIRVWAEKELRNLRRLVQGGVKAPKVIECKENVLVMEFLGKGDEASPRLKDADIDDLAPQLYVELLIAVRRMYRNCHLVHADLSEYNILLHNEHLYIIDVSQSVEHDHPRAFDFLRADLANVEDYFSRRGVRVIGLRRAWDFVVTENDDLEDSESTLEEILRQRMEIPADPVEDAVFLSSYIPRTLSEVYDPERDVDVLKRGDGEQLIYAGVTGLDTRGSSKKAKEGKEVKENKEKTEIKGDAKEVNEIKEEVKTVGLKETKGVRFEDEVEDDESDDEGEDEVEEEGERKSRGFRHEDKDAKKERKKAVKEENKERRKNKMPKAEKAKLIKKSHHK